MKLDTIFQQDYNPKGVGKKINTKKLFKKKCCQDSFALQELFEEDNVLYILAEKNRQ